MGLERKKVDVEPMASSNPVAAVALTSLESIRQRVMSMTRREVSLVTSEG